MMLQGLSRLLEKMPFLKSRRSQWLAFGLIPCLGILSASAVVGTKQVGDGPEFTRIIENLPLPEFKVQQQDALYWLEHEVKVGDTFSSFLAEQGVSPEESKQLISQHFKGHSPRLHAGQLISIQFNQNNELQALQFFQDDEDGEKNLVALEKQDNQWQATKDIADTETIVTLRAITVQTSARGALARSGVPVEIRETINELFSDKFSLDNLKEGDAVRVLFENHYFRGQPIATGNIQAIEVRHQGKIYQAYYFEHGEDSGAFYDAKGRPLSKGFTVKPVEYKRISSPFGMRYHPILQVWKSHSGIDYAAPTGTPVIAPAVGVIEEVGVKGGYGNAIVLRHRDSLQTLYGHLSAFAAGMRPGKTVQPGDVIGFVGATGRATGPHLHYEVRVNGQAVNPATAALPVRELAKDELVPFQAMQRADDQRFAQVRHLRIMVSQLD